MSTKFIYYRFLWFIFIALFSLYSCENKQLDEYTQAGHYSNIIHLGFEAQEEQETSHNTKMAIDYTNKVFWTEGDQIAYCITNGSSTSYNISTVNCESSEITMLIPNGYHRDNYAIYPASSRGSDYSTPTIVYPSSYELSGKDAELYSPLPMVAINTNGDLLFYHTGGLLRLYLTNINVSTSKVTVSLDYNDNICGTYSVMSAGTTATSLRILSGGGNTITFTGVSVSNGCTWLNIPLPRGTNANSITVKTYNSSNVELQSVKTKIGWSSVWRNSGHQHIVNMLEVVDNSPLPGVFSVSATKKVRFSKGNLQAVLATDPVNYTSTALEWRFADNQYDRIFNNPGNTTFEKYSTVDLFCFVSSDASSEYKNSYGLQCVPGGVDPHDDIGYTEWEKRFGGGGKSLAVDWGSIPEVKSSLGTGWRTMTSTEFMYLLGWGNGTSYSGRPNAASKRTITSISINNNYIYGILILPDDFTYPSGMSSIPSSPSLSTFKAFTDAGAVFLPFASYRDALSVSNTSGYSLYWCSNGDGNSYYDYAWHLWSEGTNSDFRYLKITKSQNLGYGGSVRLVMDVN